MFFQADVFGAKKKKSPISSAPKLFIALNGCELRLFSRMLRVLSKLCQHRTKPQTRIMITGHGSRQIFSSSISLYNFRGRLLRDSQINNISGIIYIRVSKFSNPPVSKVSAGTHETCEEKDEDPEKRSESLNCKKSLALEQSKMRNVYQKMEGLGSRTLAQT